MEEIIRKPRGFLILQVGLASFKTGSGRSWRNTSGNLVAALCFHHLVSRTFGQQKHQSRRGALPEGRSCVEKQRRDGQKRGENKRVLERRGKPLAERLLVFAFHLGAASEAGGFFFFKTRITFAAAAQH